MTPNTAPRDAGENILVQHPSFDARTWNQLSDSTRDISFLLKTIAKLTCVGRAKKAARREVGHRLRHPREQGPPASRQAARTGRVPSSEVRLREFHDRPWMLTQARKLIDGKLQSFEEPVLYIRRQGRADARAADFLRELPMMRQAIDVAADHGTLRGLEGNATKRWFEVFGGLLPENCQNVRRGITRVGWPLA
jgi:CRISPR associated protein Cas1